MVQGDNAPVSIINALERIIKYNESNSDNKIDVVILTRGGGSIEDLWCFNNEELAREIFTFPIPVISGVGHEIDFTICDFVSDIRVPTPTASAELVTEFNFQIQDRLNICKTDIFKMAINLQNKLSQRINLNKSKLKNPLTLIREKSQNLDNFDLRIQKQLISTLSIKKNQIDRIKSNINFNNPLSKLNLISNKIELLLNNLERSCRERILSKKKYLNEQLNNISILNPLSILDRGYSIVLNNKGQAIKSSDQVSKGEVLKARLSSGSIDLEVKKND